jgi:hypothetical protein
MCKHCRAEVRSIGAYVKKEVDNIVDWGWSEVECEKY